MISQPGRLHPATTHLAGVHPSRIHRPQPVLGSIALLTLLLILLPPGRMPSGFAATVDDPPNQPTSGTSNTQTDNAALPTTRDAQQLFEKTIAPALVAKCISCHKPDNKKGDLDLSSRTAAMRGGVMGPAIVPGKSDESPLYFRTIAEPGHRPEMPEKGEPLSPTETAAIKSWIDSAAPWPDSVTLKEKSRGDASFWSLQPLSQVEPPEPVVDDSTQAWLSNPIDRFVLHELQKHNLSPNPPATPEEFIRRATFDLTGLPPTPEELAAFEQACLSTATHTSNKSGAAATAPQLSDSACQELIDRLLASPAYGERWGRHWLDVVRFGESRGYERNEIITNLWPFRDYVIRRLNSDTPFNQLIVEHLAGDVIGRDQPDTEVGSAFLVAGPYDDVGNQDAAAAAQIRADQMDEMIRATSEAFLGVSLGCARCHDHKFDPLTTRDYYAMSSAFAGTVHGPREVSTVEERARRTALLEPLVASRAKLLADRDQREKDIQSRAAAALAAESAKWIRPAASRFLTEEQFPVVEARMIRLTGFGTDTAEPQRTQFYIDEFEVWTDSAESENVALASRGGKAIGASREANDFAGAYSAALVIDGQFGERWHAQQPSLLITLAEPKRISRITFSSDRPRALADGHVLAPFVGDYEIDVSLDGEKWTRVADSWNRLPVTEIRKTARMRERVLTQNDREFLAAKTLEQQRVEAAIAAVPGISSWWVGTHRDIKDPQNVFIGGNPQQRGDSVTPASFEVLTGPGSKFQLPPTATEGERRLAYARWIAADDNPLSPRVLANRVWQHHFGKGIVDTPSDFGFLGGRPTHPELLDWLARKLIADGWRIKSLHRLIMMSQSYRQSAAYRETAAKVDSASRYLWRFPPRRLAAEEIRDTILSVAGVLDRTMYGPGFRLYEYQQDNVATYVPLDKPGPETYRRSIYHHNARAARVDVLTDFDCPDPAFAEPYRSSTTTPLQALTMLNHQFSIDMAQQFAARLDREAGADVPNRIRRAFTIAYGRLPTDAEITDATAFVSTAGWIPFCRAILNSNELLSVY